LFIEVESKYKPKTKEILPMNITIKSSLERLFFRFTLILLAITSTALLPEAQAVIPAPDGGYPGGNTAEGQNALLSLSTGGYNTAVGFFSLSSDNTGSLNTAVGAGALLANTGGENTATGVGALLRNTTGIQNTADGEFALANNTTGLGNTALGKFAGSGVTTANNVICIGADGMNVANTCFIGNIYGQLPSGSPLTVVVDSQGQLGTSASSRRFKQDIQPMAKASEALLALKPVTFHYKRDAKNTPCFGLIAEEVAEVNPDLVVRDKAGQALSVRYEQVNAMLLNEFLKEHCRVEKQDCKLQQHESTIAELKSEMKALIATVTEQASELRKVRAEVQITEPTMRIAAESP